MGTNEHTFAVRHQVFLVSCQVGERFSAVFNLANVLFFNVLMGSIWVQLLVANGLQVLAIVEVARVGRHIF